jgi:FkbM family methyltransferase
MGFEIYETYGFKIYLDTSESPMMKARAAENYEVEKFRFLSSVLTKDITFIDVGANKGDFTLHAARYAGRVFSIEPHPDNLSWLRKSVDLNSFDNVTIIPGCATDSEGECILNVGRYSGHHSLVRYEHSRISVAGFRLDRLGIAGDIVVKIDVEGAEKLVLAGSSDILSQFRYALIDVDSGDYEGVRTLLPGMELIKRSGKEVFYRRIDD